MRQLQSSFSYIVFLSVFSSYELFTQSLLSIKQMQSRPFRFQGLLSTYSWPCRCSVFSPLTLKRRAFKVSVLSPLIPDYIPAERAFVPRLTQHPPCWPGQRHLKRKTRRTPQSLRFLILILGLLKDLRVSTSATRRVYIFGTSSVR